MNYTPEQQRAIETTGVDICVDAGAGSGKTRVLVDRIAGLLENPELYMREIAAITFTEKAAGEMKERLRLACHRRAPADDPDAMTFWRTRERETESARISTIHAFCTRVLKENALAAGFDPDFGMLADAAGELLRTESVRTALNETFERQEAGPVAVATCYGIGRTNAMMAELLRRSALMARVTEAFPYDDPIALSKRWIRVAEDEFERCAMNLARGTWARGWLRRLRRFDGECVNESDKREILRQGQLRLLEDMTRASTPKEVYGLLESLQDKGEGRASKNNWSSDAVFKDLSKAQDKLVKEASGHLPPTPVPQREMEAVMLACAAADTYEVVQRTYTEAKRAQNVMDFDDLITETSTLLRERPDIRQKTAAGLKYVLIDEFQDTDQTQLDLAYALAPREGAAGAELFIVGDAKQSIYDFRGAEVEVFSKAREACAEVIPLDRNFRSTPEIIDFINAFFTASGVMEAGGIAYHPLLAHRPAAGECRVEILTPEVVDGHRKEDYRRDEAALLADRLAGLCGPDGATVVDEDTGTTRPAGFGDVAILFRSSSNVHLYESALRAKGIPFVVVAGSGFFSRQEVNDIRNLLTVLVDPWDEYALLGFLRGPFVGLIDASIVLLNEQGGLAKAFNGTGSLDDDAEAGHLAVGRALVAELRAGVTKPLPVFLRDVLTGTQFEAILLAQHHGLQKAGNVRKLVDLADEFARSEAGSLRAFARYLDDLTARELREGDVSISGSAEGAVTIMTIHQSKGLEFPIVALADCGRDPSAGHNRSPIAVHRRLGLVVKPPDDLGDGASPILWEALDRAEHDQTLSEHARIFYVALTRARDWLLIGGDPSGDRDSWLGQLDDAFGVLERTDGERVDGDGWSFTVRRAPAGQKAVKDTSPTPSPVDGTRLLAQAARLEAPESPRVVASVSAVLAALEGESPAQPGRPAPEGRLDPRVRGSAVHRYFERWRVELDAEGLIAQTALEFPVSLSEAEGLESDLRAVARTFEGSELRARMAGAALRREWPFLVRAGNGFLRGTIDLIMDDSVLVDFKTGAYRAESHRRYENQLRLYASALHQLTGSWPMEAVLYYADEGRLEGVDVNAEVCSALWSRVVALFDTPETWLPGAGSSQDRDDTRPSLRDDEYDV